MLPRLSSSWLNSDQERWLCQPVPAALILRVFDGISRLKKAGDWLLSSDPMAMGRTETRPPRMILASSDGVDCKYKGLEEETLVTSSNPISQVLW
jgi:hypothetical protein